MHDQYLKTVLTEVVEVKGARNLQSPNFPQDFEIEVENISKRPIYHILIVALLPQSTTYFGQPLGFHLSFGNYRLAASGRPEPADIPLKPGETVFLKAMDAGTKHLRQYLEDRTGRENAEVILGKVALYFQIINFGDGTGYVVGKPYPSQ